MKIILIGAIAIASLALCQAERVRGAGDNNFAKRRSNKLLNKIKERNQMKEANASK